eukprot:g2827.t1
MSYPEIQYDEVEEGMVVICKKKHMLVEEVIEKQAIGKDPEKMKVKLIGTDVATGKALKCAFRRAECMIEVVSGYEGDAQKDKSASKKDGVASKQSEGTKDLSDFSVESSDAGSALTVPKRAGEVRKGSYIIVKEKPCKVIEVTTSKTGKHGHAKAKIVGIDIFTGKKYVDVCPTSHNMLEPVITNEEWQLTDIDRDNMLSLMNMAGVMKNDLGLPTKDGEATELAEEVIKKFRALSSDRSLYVTVCKAMGTEQIVGSLEKTAEGI